jgi:phosphonopyruvate decarboxylase
VIVADAFIEAGRAHGFTLYSGVPCSYLTPFINTVIDSGDLDYIGAANEGDAVAIAAGAALAGRGAVAMFQNSGLGNAVSPLTSLTHMFRIPILLIVTLRGQPAGPADEPQHALMGAITTRQLDLLHIPWELFPRDAGDIAGALARAEAHMTASGRPYGLVMVKGTVAPRPLACRPARRRLASQTVPARPDGDPATGRGEAMAVVQAVTSDADLVVATTGYTGRELYAQDDRANQLYMVGSMGCASSLALGLATACPDRRVIVLDGDGAALMRMGAMATIGHRRPANLIHLLLDNAVHESTGGQATVSGSIDFCAIAGGCGYPNLFRPDHAEALRLALAQASGDLSFIHLPIRPGVPADLPRPKITPEAVAARFRRLLAAGQQPTAQPAVSQA